MTTLTKLKIKARLILIAITVFIVGGLSFAFSFCTDRDTSMEFLLKHGFKPLNVGGYAWMYGDRNLYRTKFTAIDAKGDTIRGVVTGGIFNHATGIYFK